MTTSEPVPVEVFYAYGYKGRDMLAIRAPFAMSGDHELVGRALRIGSRAFRVMSVARQISGPIQRGEPIGVEAVALPEEGAQGPAAP